MTQEIIASTDQPTDMAARDAAVVAAREALTRLLEGIKGITGDQARAAHWAKIEQAERQCAAAHAARGDVGDAGQVEMFHQLAEHSHEAAASYRPVVTS
jgi:hypothetical protein